MDKSLTQITFDFSAPSPEEEKKPLKEEVDPPRAFLSGNPLPPPPAPIKRTRGRKTLKEGEAELDEVEIPADEILFQKQYYSIGEVASMFRVNTSLIRYWENEFDILEPRKNRKGDRHFRPADIKNLQMIHDLLRRRKFTIEGARDFIKRNRQARERYELVFSLQKVKAFLQELKANL
jgi:DNA-binding transcriptional MerR regulator